MMPNVNANAAITGMIQRFMRAPLSISCSRS
jgi:hypothetical protein